MFFKKINNRIDDLEDNLDNCNKIIELLMKESNKNAMIIKHLMDRLGIVADIGENTLVINKK